MGRPFDPNARHRVKPHITHGYTYASTQPPYIDEITGKRKYRYIHWGTVDENKKFHPGHNFYLASPEERASLLFPEDWDISEAEKFTDLRKPGRPVPDTDPQNRLYGDIWLLEQIAEKTGIRHDLEVVFDDNCEIVNDILTLAMFPYITKFTYNRVAKWQDAVKTPSSRELTSSAITRLTYSIHEHHRMELLHLRAKRLGKNEVCAVDSTTRSAYGSSLANIRWGKNKDHLLLPQTTEVVVYTLSHHMPVYYQTFPGNIPDSRTFDVIFTDLDRAGFKDLVFVTDRGYETLRSLEKMIERGQAMVMCTAVGQRDVAQIIQGIGTFDTRPDGMEIDSEVRIYYKQYDIEYFIEKPGKKVKMANHLKLNLYFDSIRRSSQLVELDIAMEFQREILQDLVKKKSVVDITIVKKECNYYNVVYDAETDTIQSFEPNEEKLEKIRQNSGFFAVMTHKLDFDPMKTFYTYSLRDEQEKCFQQMEDQMGADRQRNWLEDGKAGRLFILFVALTLSSHLRYVWKSTDLHERFSSPFEILDEMRPIRYIEHTSRAKKMTPFVDAQVDICNAFGFEIPKGCEPTCVTRKNKNGKEEGRQRNTLRKINSREK